MTGFHYLVDDGITGCAVCSIYEDRQGRIWKRGLLGTGLKTG